MRYSNIVWNFSVSLLFVLVVVPPPSLVVVLFVRASCCSSSSSPYNVAVIRKATYSTIRSCRRRRPNGGIPNTSSSSSSSSSKDRNSILVLDQQRHRVELLPHNSRDPEEEEEGGGVVVQFVTGGPKSNIARNLLRGALLRIASDLTGGTPLESIKSRVAVTREGPWEATQNIISTSTNNNHTNGGGIQALWTGTPARTLEGALQGAMFVAGSTATKKLILANGGSSTLAALCGGCVGGIAQSLIMTPAGVIFTTLNVHRNRGYNAWTVTKQIWEDRGIRGMYTGIVPMVLRQSTNWASRAGLTELARTQFQMSQYGVWGELGSGIIGGIGSCWNTPIETVRIRMQRDVVVVAGDDLNTKKKSARNYIDEIMEEDGIPGLFRGITPRAIQAIWQTTFMVVVPNLLGV